MKDFFSHRARRVRREDGEKNILKEMVFYSEKFFSFPVSSVASSAAGERNLLSPG
jgi:hypothetical protein